MHPCRSILILLCLTVTVQAQDIQLRDSTVATLRTATHNDLPEQITSRLEPFFQKLLNDSPETAFFTLFQGTPFNDKNEVIDKITATSRKSVEEFGAYTSYEFTESESFGEKSHLVTYITEMPKKLLRWRFFFYSPGGTDWTFANIKVDDFRNYLPRDPNQKAPPVTIQLDIEKFFINLQSRQVRAGMEGLLTGSRVPDYQNTIEEFIRLVEAAQAEYGDMQAYELYDRTQVGSRHVLLTYFTYLDTEPLRWQFIYRLEAPGSWKLANLRFDDLLDEAVLID